MLIIHQLQHTITNFDSYLLVFEQAVYICHSILGKQSLLCLLLNSSMEYET